ncbi:MAG: T9SS type A sorting domain-containing protein [Flavobacteriaceae bacterium]|nr:T9SS type A sorting domain-containing protein [Flavobacteriaceae bacterium]
MKQITFMLVLLIATFSYAQVNDFIFVHTVIGVTGPSSEIDHPDLNGNPNAIIAISHNKNPGGNEDAPNPHISGVFYNESSAKWAILNESFNSMLDGVSFNVYVKGDDSLGESRLSTPENTDVSYMVLDHAGLNGNPSAIIIMTNLYAGVQNINNYGFRYTGTQWVIHNEGNNGDSPIPEGASFNIIAPSDNNVVAYKHSNTAGNTTGSTTVINHPFLNGKPNAVFVFSHNYGQEGDPENVIIDKVLTAKYNGSNWSIETEDLSDMPNNAIFNLAIMTSEVASTNTNELVNFNLYPNPVKNTLNINSEEVLTKITIVNLLGQEVKFLNPESTHVTLELSDLDAGVYLIKINANDRQSTRKFIKQ